MASKYYLTCLLVTAATALTERHAFIAAESSAAAVVPRYFVDVGAPIAQRVAQCDNDHHPCRDTGSDTCCADHQYCYVNQDFRARCCPLGLSCKEDNPCDKDHYLCTLTVEQSGVSTTTAATATQSLSTACCPRGCATSQYLCPSSLGGACCPFGQECVAGGHCVSTVTVPPPPNLTPIVEGCTTSQFKCQDGLGCCDNTRSCTVINGEGFCALATRVDGSIITSTADDDVDDDDGDSGLSTGAIAGVAVGAVAGIGMIVGFLFWLRQSNKQRQMDREKRQQQQGGAAGQQGGRGGGLTISTNPRPRFGRGPTQQYDGPNAQHGPYTEMSPVEGHARQLPLQPEKQPHDYMGAAEMDSTGRSDDGASVRTPMSATGFHATTPPAAHHETIDERFELHGSPYVPPHEKGDDEPRGFT